VGSLIDVIAGGYSHNILPNNPRTWLPYDSWVRQTNAEITGKSGPVTTISIGKTEIDRVLDELGVIRRGGCVENTDRVSSGLCGSNPRRVHSVGGNVQEVSQKVTLQPKDLMVEDLQDLVGGQVKYQEIMEMYGFTSERYFKETIKPLGYRLLRGELWVVKDKLWLN